MFSRSIYFKKINPDTVSDLDYTAYTPGDHTATLELFARGAARGARCGSSRDVVIDTVDTIAGDETFRAPDSPQPSALQNIPQKCA
eukprot:SAG31_NODE_13917_length_837_cov_2.447154_2_plen_86_part_00